MKSIHAWEEMHGTLISFMNERDGGIELFDATRHSIGWANTPAGIANILTTCGMANSVFSIDPMDDEDALHLWEDAIKIYNFNVNGIAG